MMYILTLTSYQNKSIQLVSFFIFHIFFCLRKYQVLIKLATFVWGFQLYKVTSPTAINFSARVLNTDILMCLGQIGTGTKTIVLKVIGDVTR